MLKRHAVDMLTGDFNMGLWEVLQKLNHIAQPVMVSCILWHIGSGGAILEGSDDSSDDSPADAGSSTAASAPAPVTGRPPVAADLRSDSYGVFRFYL